jgi:DNA polymerase III subunit epsilon
VVTNGSLPVLPRDRVPPTARLAAIVDVETTGLSPARDRIVEFAGLLFAWDESTGRVLGLVYEYSTLNDPGVPIPREATKIHGITKKMVKGRSLDPRKVDSLLSEAEFIISHNSGFDYGFLAPISATARSKPWRCSMRGIDWIANGCPSRGLQDLLGHYGIAARSAHRARDDVRCTLQLLAKTDRLGSPFIKQLLTEDPGVAEHASADKDGIKVQWEISSNRPAPVVSQPKGPNTSQRVFNSCALVFAILVAAFLALLILLASI